MLSLELYYSHNITHEFWLKLIFDLGNLNYHFLISWSRSYQSIWNCALVNLIDIHLFRSFHKTCYLIHCLDRARRLNTCAIQSLHMWWYLDRNECWVLQLLVMEVLSHSGCPPLQMLIESLSPLWTCRSNCGGSCSETFGNLSPDMLKEFILFKTHTLL